MQQDTTSPQMEFDRARAVIKQFMQADRLHRQAVEATVTAQTGLHRSQHMLLMRLSHCCIPSQKDLAKDLRVSPAAIAVSLKKLESDGYITRNTDTDDCRYNRIALTEKGLGVVTQTKELFHYIDQTMVQGFDDAEMDALLASLEKIERNLQALLDGANLPPRKETQE